MQDKASVGWEFHSALRNMRARHMDQKRNGETTGERSAAPPSTQARRRIERRAEALRANLKRRKQSRERLPAQEQPQSDCIAETTE